jgi:hypothetical protein
MAEIHLNDIGTVPRLTVYRENGDLETSLGSATKLRIKLQDPGGTSVTKIAVLSTDGSDGKMQYTTVLNDVDDVGSWKIQGYIEMGGGKWHTSKRDFEVLGIL